MQYSSQSLHCVRVLYVFLPPFLFHFFVLMHSNKFAVPLIYEYSRVRRIGILCDFHQLASWLGAVTYVLYSCTYTNFQLLIFVISASSSNREFNSKLLYYRVECRREFTLSSACRNMLQDVDHGAAPSM